MGDPQRPTPDPFVRDDLEVDAGGESTLSPLPSADPSRGARALEGLPRGAQKKGMLARESGVNFVAPLPQDLSEVFLARLTELNRAVTGEMHDEEIVQRYVAAIGELLPERHVVVRLLTPGTSQLGLVFANGRLRAAQRERLALSLGSVERHGLAPEQLSEAGVAVDEEYRPSFDGGPSAPDALDGAGFDVPLLDGGHLLGVVGVEHRYAPQHVEQRVVEHLCLSLSQALKNARLTRESGYLRRRLAKLMDHADAPILVLDRHRQVAAVNRAFLALTGLDKTSLLGRDFLGVLPVEDRPRALSAFLRGLAGQTSSAFELRFRKKGGGAARVSLNAVPVYSPEGEADGLMAVGTDRTEVRDLEQQIVQAEKLATLGQLAAGIVHELNNPLTSISVYSEYLLRKGEKTGTEARDLEKMRRIRESAERVLRFTRDLMTYARPSSEEPTRLSIRDVLARSVLFCEHVIREVRAEVVTDYEEPLPLFHGIKGQLHQVFINLITNACHALPKEGGRLRLAAKVELGSEGDPAEARAPAEACLLVVIEDNGGGIPEEVQAKIFAPFFTTKKEGKGTGLGLSIVKGIVERHRGTIAIAHSSQEGGTRFEIRLPLSAGDHSAGDRSAEDRSAGDRGPEDLG